MNFNDRRRSVLKKLLTGTVAIASTPLWPKIAYANKSETLKNNINHSVCRWTFSQLSLDDLCLLVKEIGFNAIDLAGPADWDTLQKHGVHSSMCNGAEMGLEKGWNNKAYHQQLIKNYTEVIPMVSQNGYRNLICFSGNRDGMDDETGLNNCVEGLKKILPLAEKSGVVIHMELLNSKVDHPDQMCDNTIWGVELCKRLDSENFKLLYDIYHMQVSEGDIIHTINDNHLYIGHYHTAGVPGRHEIDHSQELNYPAIMKAILETGFKGYVAQEFKPAKDDKQASLREAIHLCDI
ncbi:TIM barrel protein [Fulvivirga kasyanovii]|uniref:Hydroxypyruvate isomerase n=1 Tax=Fulvivirga kasyanovii TaxID=396812 RepID=A0ABW9RJ60_9BACT|nr:TIM barrel protein [Fulvivirga kasyanovii]MTI24113.1 hydroxypyruvate isomerase [Fulvivirga kasyanovii]